MAALHNHYLRFFISGCHTGAGLIGFKPPPPFLPDNEQASALEWGSQKCTLHFFSPGSSCKKQHQLCRISKHLTIPDLCLQPHNGKFLTPTLSPQAESRSPRYVCDQQSRFPRCTGLGWGGIFGFFGQSELRREQGLLCYRIRTPLRNKSGTVE